MWGRKDARIRELEARCGSLAEVLADVTDERDNFRESAEKLDVEVKGLRGALKRFAEQNRALNAQLLAERKKSGFDDGRARMTAARMERNRQATAHGRADAAKAPTPGRADVQDGGAS